MLADRFRGCTGLAAQWCPRCGTCRCDPDALAVDDPRCPLHGYDSRHADAAGRLAAIVGDLLDELHEHAGTLRRALRPVGWLLAFCLFVAGLTVFAAAVTTLISR